VLLDANVHRDMLYFLPLGLTVLRRLSQFVDSAMRLRLAVSPGLSLHVGGLADDRVM